MPDPTPQPGNTGSPDNIVQSHSTTSGGEAPIGGWRERLPEPLRGEKVFESFKADKPEDLVPVPHTLAKSYAELVKKQGSAIWLPEKDAPKDKSKELLDSVYKKLGWPEKHTDYDVPQPHIKNNVWKPETHESFMQSLHAAQLNPTQAKAVYESVAKIANDLIGEDFGEQATKMEAQLKGEWGAGFATNMNYAIRAMRHIGGDEFMKYVEGNPVGNNPDFIKAWAKVGKMMVEDGMLPSASDLTSTREGLEKEKQTLESDPAWRDRANPKHDSIIKRLTEIYQMLEAV